MSVNNGTSHSANYGSTANPQTFRFARATSEKQAEPTMDDIPSFDIDLEPELSTVVESAALRPNLKDAKIVSPSEGKKRGRPVGSTNKTLDDTQVGPLNPYTFDADTSDGDDEDEEKIAITTKKRNQILPVIAAPLYQWRLLDSYLDAVKTYKYQGLAIKNACTAILDILENRNDYAILLSYVPTAYSADDEKDIAVADRRYAEVEARLLSFLRLAADKKQKRGRKAQTATVEDESDSAFEAADFSDASDRVGRFMLIPLKSVPDHNGVMVKRYEIRVNSPIAICIPSLQPGAKTGPGTPIGEVLAKFQATLRNNWHRPPLEIFEETLTSSTLWTEGLTASNRADISDYLQTAKATLLKTSIKRSYPQRVNKSSRFEGEKSFANMRPSAQKDLYNHTDPDAVPLDLSVEAELNNEYFAIYTKFVYMAQSVALTSSVDSDALQAYLCFMITPRYLMREGSQEPQVSDVFDWSFSFLTNLAAERYGSFGPIAPFSELLAKDKVVDNSRDRSGFVVLGNGNNSYINPLGLRAVEFYNNLRNEIITYFAKFNPPLPIAAPMEVKLVLERTIQYQRAAATSTDPNEETKATIDQRVSDYLTKLQLFSNSTIDVNWDLNVRVISTANGYVKAARDIRGAIPLNDGMLVDTLYPRKAATGNNMLGMSSSALDTDAIEKGIRFRHVASRLTSLALFMHFIGKNKYRNEFKFDANELKTRYENRHQAIINLLQANPVANGQALRIVNKSWANVSKALLQLDNLLKHTSNQTNEKTYEWYSDCKNLVNIIDAGLDFELYDFSVTATLYYPSENEGGDDNEGDNEGIYLTVNNKRKLMDSGWSNYEEVLQQGDLDKTPHVKLRQASEYRLMTSLVLDFLEPLANLVVPPSQKWKDLKPDFFNDITFLVKQQTKNNALIPLHYFDDPASMLLLGLSKAQDWDSILVEVDTLRQERMSSQTYLGPSTPNEIAEATANPLPIPFLKTGQQLMPHQYAALMTAAKTTPNPKTLLPGDVNGYIADIEPGGGKTFICIAEMCMLLSRGWIRRPLVIVPQGLISNWATEIANFTKGRINVIVINKTTAGSAAAWKVPVSGPTAESDAVEDFNMLERFLQANRRIPVNTILLASHSIVRSLETVRFLDQTIEVYPWTRVFRELGVDFVALDECHNIRNATTSNAKFMYSLRTIPTLKYIRLYSGTMIVDKPVDLLGQVNLINPAALGGTAEKFNKRFLREELGVDSKPVRVADVPKVTSALNRNMTIVRFKQRHWAKFLPRLEEVVVFIDADLTTALNVQDGWQKSYAAFLRWYNILLSETLNDFISRHKDDDDGSANKKLATIFAKMRDSSNKTKVVYNSDGLVVEPPGAAEELQGLDEDEQEKALRFCLQKVEQFALYPKFLQKFRDALAAAEAGTAKDELETIAPLVRSPKIYDPYNGLLATMDRAFKEAKEQAGRERDARPLKIVVTCTYQVGLDAVEEAFKEHRGGIYSNQAVYCTSGNTSDIVEFTQGSKTILVGTDGTIGTGLNLQVASLMIRLDFPWTPGALVQAMARIFRPGANMDENGNLLASRRKIEVMHLVTNFTLESAKFQRLLCKTIQKAKIDEASSSDVNEIQNLPIPPLTKMSASLFRSGSRDSGEILGWIRQPSENNRPLAFADLKRGDRVYNRFGISGKVAILTDKGCEIYWEVSNFETQPRKVLNNNLIPTLIDPNDEQTNELKIAYPLYRANPNSNLDVAPQAIEGKTLGVYIRYKDTYNKLLDKYADKYKDLGMVEAGIIDPPEGSELILIRKPGDFVKLPEAKRVPVESMANAPYSFGPGELTLDILNRWAKGLIANQALGPAADQFIQTRWADGEVYERAMERTGGQEGAGVLSIPTGYDQVRLSNKQINGWFEFKVEETILQNFRNLKIWKSDTSPVIWSSRPLALHGGLCVRTTYDQVEITTSQLVAILPVQNKFMIYLANPSDPTRLLHFVYIEQANVFDERQDPRMQVTLYSPDDFDAFNKLYRELQQQVAIDEVEKEATQQPLSKPAPSGGKPSLKVIDKLDKLDRLERELSKLPKSPVQQQQQQQQPPVTVDTTDTEKQPPVNVSGRLGVDTAQVQGERYLSLSAIVSAIRKPGDSIETTYAKLVAELQQNTIVLYTLSNKYRSYVPMGFNAGILSRAMLSYVNQQPVVGKVVVGTLDPTFTGGFVLLHDLLKAYPTLAKNYQQTIAPNFLAFLNTLGVVRPERVSEDVAQQLVPILTALDSLDESRFKKALGRELSAQERMLFDQSPFSARAEILIPVENPYILESDLQNMPQIAKAYGKLPAQSEQPTKVESVIDTITINDNDILIVDDVLEQAVEAQNMYELAKPTYDKITDSWGPLPDVGTHITSIDKIQLVWELVGPRPDGNLLVRRREVIFPNGNTFAYPNPIEEVIDFKQLANSVYYPAGSFQKKKLKTNRSTVNAKAPLIFSTLDQLRAAVPQDNSWKDVPFWIYDYSNNTVKEIVGLSHSSQKGQPVIAFRHDGKLLALKQMENRIIFSQQLIPKNAAVVVEERQTSAPVTIVPPVVPPTAVELLPSNDPPARVAAVPKAPASNLPSVAPVNMQDVPAPVMQELQNLAAPAILKLIWNVPSQRQEVYDTALAIVRSKQEAATPAVVEQVIEQPAATTDEIQHEVNLGVWNGIRSVLLSGEKPYHDMGNEETYNLGKVLEINVPDEHSANFIEKGLELIVKELNQLGLPMDVETSSLVRFFMSRALMTARSRPTQPVLEAAMGKTKSGLSVYLYPAAVEDKKVLMIQFSPMASSKLGTVLKELRQKLSKINQAFKIVVKPNRQVVLTFPEHWKKTDKALYEDFKVYSVMPSANIKVLLPVTGNPGPMSSLTTK